MCPKFTIDRARRPLTARPIRSCRKANLHASLSAGFLFEMSANNQTKSNGRGGPRKGAGRKPGSATKKTREIADRAAAEGITPLEFMLNVMRRDTAHEDPKVAVAREALAFEAAKAAAPYMHPRLQAIEHSGPNGGPIELTAKEQRDAAVEAALRADR